MIFKFFIIKLNSWVNIALNADINVRNNIDTLKYKAYIGGGCYINLLGRNSEKM